MVISYLGEILDKQGRTQVWLAKRLKVTPDTILNWVNGKCQPHPKVIEYVSDLLGVPAHLIWPHATITSELSEQE